MQTRERVMKKIILMCLFGLMFSQVKLETRLYDIQIDTYINSSPFYIDLLEITGYDLDLAIIEVVTNNDYSSSGLGSMRLDYLCDGTDTKMFFEHYPDEFQIGSSHHIFRKNQNCRLLQIFTNNAYQRTITISITAEFPEEDTGYIEEGFDFCLASGNNLVAFPCDNPVSVNTALPDLAQSEIESIIGAGDAAININGQFQGSLSNFTPGKGYWFKSESSFCFNYTCAE